MEDSIADINQKILNCKYCRLYSTRVNSVCGEGVIPAKFMFIAQAPGRSEDLGGKLLIGPSGKVFDQILSNVGLQRKDIYITNLIKCFLPKCRKPKADEIKTCFDLYLQREIKLVKPEIMVTLGYHVSKFIFKTYELKVPTRIEFRETFGKLYVAKNKKIVPVRHPATVVHKSKQLPKLICDYSILKTLQSDCPLISKCENYNKYKKGFIPHHEIERYCFGNWKECIFYQ